ncbi:DNA polymerase IV [Pseudonocardia sp. NPDC049635]|uniref:DNA polymerase IV n=1 Tax=Pseudonocardia sp. NPDC049635 TaxID=3155506 RepID=UPI0034045531
MFVRGLATILHADLDAFYASVEQRDDPRLRDRPVIVGGGVVLAASYEAKAYGVATAMGGRQARALCPAAVVVPPRMAVYAAASRAVFAIFRDLTPQVEGLSIDEAFLEVGGLARISGAPRDIAVRLRERVLAEAGLPITVGVARTKFLAKVASGVAKPDGLLVVDPDRERQFLHPLPVERLWGVGAVTAARLHELGVRTVAEVADLGEAALMSLLGPAAGRHLHALAHLRDPRPVETGRSRRSIGSQQALGRRRREPDELDAILAGTVDRLARRLRAPRDGGSSGSTGSGGPAAPGGGRVCRTVVLRLRFADHSRVTRSHTLQVPTAHTATILGAARRLLAAALPEIRERGITLLGLSLTNLDRDDALQWELPFDARSGQALDTALDAVRRRFGAGSLCRATGLGRSDDPGVPLLPEHE